MLDEFRQRHSHMALVVDEFGTVTGLVTVEDVLEQIVGEIEDEFDEKPAVPPAETGRLELDGALTVRDLETLYGIELPANAGFETIAGYMLFRLGHIPKTGESVELDERTLTVAEMDRNRISRIVVEKVPVETPPAEPHPAEPRPGDPPAAASETKREPSGLAEKGEREPQIAGH